MTVKFVVAGALTIIVLIAALLAANNHFVSSHLESTYPDKAITIANALNNSIHNGTEFENRQQLTSSIGAYVQITPELLSVTIFRPQGSGLIGFISSRPELVDEMASIDNVEAFRDNRVITREIETGAGRLLRVYTPIHIADETVGTFQFDLTLENLDILGQEMLRSMILIFLPLFVITLFMLGLFVRKRIVQPLLAIGKATKEITQGNFDSRLEINSAGQLRGLCEDINQMVSSLEQQRTAILDTTNDFEHQALHDPLTGLPNRSFLEQQFPQYLASSKRHQRRGALLLLDLDRLKWVNDNLGHNTGDGLLRIVAQRIENILRQEDFIARLGGDEFVIVLSEVSSDTDQVIHQIKSVVDALLDNIASPVKIGDNEFRVTASIGIVFFPGREEELQEIMNNADSAMYKAKQDGGNRGCFFDQSMQQILVNKANVLGTLKQAIDSNQLSIFYQPQVNNQGRIVGAEALVRWIHPQRGLMLPVDFVNAIENNSLIFELGQWVLHTVCQQYQELCERYAGDSDFSIAINICASQLNQVDFVEQTIATLNQYKLSPQILVLEITESALLNNSVDARNKVKLIKQHGIRVSIDDYGTGCSSLTCLKDLAFDEIKLDCELVHKISESARNRELVCAIIGMSQSLNMTLVAEGVETQEQYDFLQAHNCQVYQGLHFQEPLPLSSLES